jgi:hypothetical protein
MKMDRKEMYRKLEQMAHEEAIGKTKGNKARATLKAWDAIIQAKKKNTISLEEIERKKEMIVGHYQLEGFLADCINEA